MPPGQSWACSNPSQTSWQVLQMPCPQGWLQNYGLPCADTARWELEGKMHAVSSSALILRVSFTRTEQQWEMPVVVPNC